MVTKAALKRQQLIVDVLDDAFADLMTADPHAFRVKFRKMAADPFAFYRGSACLFYADMTTAKDAVGRRPHQPGVDPRRPARRELRHLHELARPDGLRRQRLRRGLHRALLLGPAPLRGQPGAAWAGRRRCPTTRCATLIGRYLRAYLAQVTHYADVERRGRRLRAAPGEHRRPGARRADARPGPPAGSTLLDSMTRFEDSVRVFSEDASVRRLGKAERRKVEKAFEDYLQTIPESKKFDRALFYEVRDIVGKSGFGIGSAGLPAYNVLVEGYSQSLDNDVVLSMKQANVPAVSRFVDTSVGRQATSSTRGTAPSVSQRALQVHTDPLLGYTEPRRRRVRRRRDLALRVRPGLGRDQRARRDGQRRAEPRPRHRQGALRLRRGQRPEPGDVPDRGGDRRGRRGPAQGVRRRPDRLRGRLRRCGSAATTRCSSTRSARAGSAASARPPARPGWSSLVADPTGWSSLS